MYVCVFVRFYWNEIAVKFSRKVDVLKNVVSNANIRMQ